MRLNKANDIRIIHMELEGSAALLVQLDEEFCYDPNKVLGKGGFGCVYAGLKNSRYPVAVKHILKSVVSLKELQQLKREIETMRRIDHKNVLKLIHHLDIPNPTTGRKELYVITELCTGGNLAELIESYRSTDRRFSELTVLRFLE